MLRVVAILALIAMYISFAVDVARTNAAQVRALRKWIWFAIVVVFPFIGAALWWALGRPRGTGGRWRRRRPVAPDDDPRFLRELGDQAWRERMRRRRGELGDPGPAEPA